MSKEQMQVKAVQHLLDQQEQASGFGFSPEFITVSIAMVRNAMDQGALEFFGVCPECDQGKHGNCTNDALNDDDVIDVCRCSAGGHGE